MEGAERETVRDRASVGGGYEAETEVAVDEKGPEGLGLTEGG